MAVLAIHHPPKDAPRKAIHAFSGSLAFVAGPRIAFIVTEDPEDNEGKGKLLLPVKNNLGPKAVGLGYQEVETAVDGRISTSVIEWDRELVVVSDSEALPPTNNCHPPCARCARGGGRARHGLICSMSMEATCQDSNV